MGNVRMVTLSTTSKRSNDMSRSKYFLGLTATLMLSALIGAAAEQQPPCAISDVSDNTACGSSALISNATGCNNAASGAQSLIASLGGDTEKLFQLRPVSLHVKSDLSGQLQYGLIAEEVDKVYPELLIRDTEGKIQGVRYDELAPMLLTQVQKQEITIKSQADSISSLEKQVSELTTLNSQLEELRAALASALSRDPVVVRR